MANIPAKSCRASVAGAVMVCLASFAVAQSVGLPAPRLLTTMPMGGRVGTEVEITVSGESLDDAGDLLFSDPRITAIRKLDALGNPEPNRYVVRIAPDCPVGVHEARLMTRLGISSSRAFVVGTLNEVLQSRPNTSLDTAIELPLNSVCNATISDRSVDHYSFAARQGQRVIVDCASRGIDSKLNATVIVADAAGRDLLVERRGGALDFAVPQDGKYVIKVHELTFKGGPAFYYRLGLWEQPAETPIVRQPATKAVNSFSWPPAGLGLQAEFAEAELNNDGPHAQRISLPCDLAGSFFPAADVDVFEFEAKKGDEWWIEVASERLGLPTDPSILVQHVSRAAGGETPAAEQLADVVELSDIPSPVRVSSNGYAYDGPPYDAGTADLLGKLVIQEDGLHRLRLTDVYGGTRNEPGNAYRLIIRRAAPDFALVAWALHMELRNGDRAALSKPISLRGGATMALEVVAFRRDGFDGDIELAMEGLPEGVSAQGLKIPAGRSRGLLLITAQQNAPQAFVNATFVGRAQINGQPVTRPCRLASISWPIRDSWGEIPSTRLLADVPVSVGGVDRAPLTIAPRTPRIEATVGDKLTIPLVHTRHSEFSGATMQMRVIGADFEGASAFDLSLAADASEAVLDLATLKTPPGDYLVAFHGGAVVRYRHHPEAVAAAEAAQQKSTQEVMALEAEAQKAAADAQTAPAEKKNESDQAVAALTARLKAAKDVLAAADEQLRKATAAAQPTDIVDIVVTEPISIHIKPAETK